MLQNNIDLTAFFAAVKQCEGHVFLLSSQGDKMDLKSVLCQYLFAGAFLCKDASFEGQVICESEEDRCILKPFLCE